MESKLDNSSVLKDLYTLKKMELNGDQLFTINKFISYLESASKF
jgi:hypothetical protein